MSIQLGFYFYEIHSYFECLEQCALLLSKNSFDKTAWHLMIKTIPFVSKNDYIQLYYSHIQVPKDNTDCACPTLCKDVYEFLFHHECDFERALSLAVLNQDQAFWRIRMEECRDALSSHSNLETPISSKKKVDDPWNGQVHYDLLAEKRYKGKEACLVYLFKILSTCDSIPNQVFIESCQIAQQVGQLDFVFIILQLGILQHEDLIPFVYDYIKNLN